MTMLRIVVLGDRSVGKSAVMVRFLTTRFIGEYCSETDFLYRSSIKLEDQFIEVEVLDTCTKHVSTACVVDEARAIWADAFVVVHSILSCASFTFAKDVVQTIRGLKPSAFSPVLLLANMADLDHGRQVTAAEGRRAAVEMGCQYSEVSAAEDIGVAAAFRTFLHEVRLAQHQPRGSSLKRRRSSLATVSRRLGAMFGKKDSATGVPGASSQSCPSASGAAATAHNFNDVNAKRKGILLEPKDAVKA